MELRNQMSSQRVSIVVVEDDHIDEVVTLGALRSLGLEQYVQVARTGSDAQAVLSDGKPDLVLLDIKLPGKSGHQILQWIRNHKKISRVPVVMVSNSDDPGDVRVAYEQGASGYIYKEVDSTSYGDKIKSATLFWLRGLGL